MSHEKERAYTKTRTQTSWLTTVVTGASFTVVMAVATAPASGDSLKVITGDHQSIAVQEKEGGTLTWVIRNQGAGSVTLDNGFRGTGVRFRRTGGDADDAPKVGTIGGCDSGIKLLGNGGQCVLTVDFTTPALEDPAGTNDENNDRGFWDIDTARGPDVFPALTGSTDAGLLVTSDFLIAHIEVDDPGVKAVTPEPPSILLSLTAVLLGLSALAWKQGGRVLQ
jgi:hypothetical protein